MEVYLIIAIIAIFVMAFVGYFLGNRGKQALSETVTSLTAERDVQKANANHYLQLLEDEKTDSQQRVEDLKTMYDQQIVELKSSFDQQIVELKSSFDQQMRQAKEAHDAQIATLKQMNEEQVKNQLDLIREQMQTTSEKVLKLRQEELGAQNKEQVSKIIDPLQRSLKDMQEALDKTKDGELKLKQLLEDMELQEGEQFDTQETLKDRIGKGLKGDDGRGMIPDFILHFPNNRHVVVDSKMSLTAYERYMNAEDGSVEKSGYLKAHIDSVRAQVKRLARKEYTKYLPEGYNRLNFAIMYVPIEGALNLALLNDATLWREAYDQGVMILGPQTMYMNLRVLEMMWTQVRQLKNQQTMMDAANTIIERVQVFGIRFMEVESSMNDTIKKINKLKVTTADSGQSIITAARHLLKAGARENKKKKSLAEMDESIFLEADDSDTQ